MSSSPSSSSTDIAIVNSSYGESSSTERTLKPLFAFSDPKITAAHENELPTRKERKQNLNELLVSCSYAECDKEVRRADIKVCSRCKIARYHSKECQKSDWKNHKKTCGTSDQDLGIKLAERALAVPKILEDLVRYGIFALDLISEPSNAEKFFLHVTCATRPADLGAYMQRLMAGLGPSDPNAEHCLTFEKIEKVEVEATPEKTRKLDAEARAGYHGDLPLMTAYITSEKGGGQDGSVCISMVVPREDLVGMADNPKIRVQSAMFGDSVVDADMDTFRQTINNTIRMDKANKLRLRGFEKDGFTPV